MLYKNENVNKLLLLLLLLTTTEEIEDASAVDEKLEYVQQSVETGNWENSNCANYKPVRDELCLFGKIVLRGTRIVSKKLRARVIELGHKGHQKMQKLNGACVQRSCGQVSTRKLKHSVEHAMDVKLWGAKPS